MMEEFLVVWCMSRIKSLSKIITVVLGFWVFLDMLKITCDSRAGAMCLPIGFMGGWAAGRGVVSNLKIDRFCRFLNLPTGRKETLKAI